MFQQAIGLAKVTATDETAVGREGARVRRGQHIVALAVDETSLLLGVGPHSRNTTP